MTYWSTAFSMKLKIKIIGFPEQDEHESAETTTQLCLKLFHAIRAEGVTKNDIEIAHRVNSRRSDSHYPRPIVCKFIRRLAKEEVMAHRNETSNLNPDDLDLSADFHTENIRIHEHLILRLQQLLSEANKHQFQYVWVKISEILARKSSSSQVFKLKRMVDLDNLRQSLVSNPTQDQGNKCLKCYSFIILMMWYSYWKWLRTKRRKISLKKTNCCWWSCHIITVKIWKMPTHRITLYWTLI